MSKDKNPRRVADNEAMAKTRMLRTSPQKLNLVAQMIRGKKVEKALTDLTFSKKRIAQDVKKCLQSAIANAENNHNLDVDNLIVAEAWVGKNLVMKRGRPRARRIGVVELHCRGGHHGAAAVARRCTRVWLASGDVFTGDHRLSRWRDDDHHGRWQGQRSVVRDVRGYQRGARPM